MTRYSWARRRGRDGRGAAAASGSLSRAHGSPASRRSALRSATSRRALARAGEPRAAGRAWPASRSALVGRVGAVQDLLGRGLGEQRAHVERLPERGVEADVRVPERADARAGRRSRSERAPPARPGGARAARARSRASGGTARPVWNSIGHAPLGGEREGDVQLRDARSRTREARVQLDAAAPASSAAVELARGTARRARSGRTARRGPPPRRPRSAPRRSPSRSRSRAATGTGTRRPVTPPAAIDASSLARSRREPSEASSPRWACTSTSPPLAGREGRPCSRRNRSSACVGGFDPGVTRAGS